VVFASGSDLESANPLVTVHPLSRQVQRYALFVTLAQYDSALRPTPYFARAWTWSAGRRELTFALDTALHWHDGRPTTAADVAFTIAAARDPATGYPRAVDLAGIIAVEPSGAAAVTLRFGAPQASFPTVLCELPVLPAHLLADVPRGEMRRAAFNLAPTGNGPFRFVRRDAGQRWLFARNDAFPSSLGGPPGIARFVVAVVDEPTTKFAGLVSGELDVAGIAPTSAALARRDSSIRVLSYPVQFATGVVFNSARPPFDDVRVRRAVGVAIDRRRIVDAALAGYGLPAEGPVSPSNPLAAPAGAGAFAAAPDTALADSLLDAAGWRRGANGARSRAGRALGFELLTVGSGDNALEQLVQADLARRGVRATIRSLELGAFLARARAAPKQFDALVTGVPGDLSLAYVAAMFDGALAGGPLDYAGFHTPELDSLFRATRAAGSDDERRRAWVAVQLALAREAPVAWLYHARGVQGVSHRLGGVTMDLRGELVTLARWTVPPS
jgi:peptide/nickel transport system substrate-binding protein